MEAPAGDAEDQRVRGSKGLCNPLVLLLLCMQASSLHLCLAQLSSGPAVTACSGQGEAQLKLLLELLLLSFLLPMHA